MFGFNLVFDTYCFMLVFESAGLNERANKLIIVVYVAIDMLSIIEVTT